MATYAHRRFAPPRRVLPPDVYDYFELLAEAEGGIGSGSDFHTMLTERSVDSMATWCVWGMARTATLDGSVAPMTHRIGEPLNEAEAALAAAGITRAVNDSAIYRVRDRYLHRRRPTPIRITFTQWCRALNVVRGEA